MKKLKSQGSKLPIELEKRIKAVEDCVVAWCDLETMKADDDRLKAERLREHNYKHTKTVEDYIGLQLEILKTNSEVMLDIRDCLKSLLLSKMKTGKRVLNDSN